jgi:hypothetical protein
MCRSGLARLSRISRVTNIEIYTMIRISGIQTATTSLQPPNQAQTERAQRIAFTVIFWRVPASKNQESTFTDDIIGTQPFLAVTTPTPVVIISEECTSHHYLPVPIDKDAGNCAHLRDPIAASSFYYPSGNGT